MNRFNLILSALFAAQIVLTASLYFSSHAGSDLREQKALLEAPIDSINRITVEDADGNRSVLTKTDGKWLLTDYYQLPANQNSVSNMLSLLQKSQTRWPVATTSSARQRFKLAEDTFNKKIVIAGRADSEQTLYLGTSPGFRQLHVRRATEDEVYTAKLNNHDFPVKHTDLLDKTLLQPEGEIDLVKGPDFEFRKQENNWTPVDPEGKANDEALQQFSNTLARLLVQGVEKKPGDIKEAYELHIRADQKDYRYRLYTQDEKHFIYRDDQENLVFSINQSDYERITGHKANTLVLQEPDKEENMLSEENGAAPSEDMTVSPSQQDTKSDQNSS